MKIICTQRLLYPNFGLTGQQQHRDSSEVFAVLTKDDAGLHAVYVGIIPADRTPAELDRLAGSVAHSGSKLNWKQASQYFHITEKEYRA